MARQLPHFAISNGYMIVSADDPTQVIALVHRPEHAALLAAAPELLEALGGFLWVGNNIDAMTFDPAEFRRYFEAAIVDGRAVYERLKEHNHGA